MEIKGRDLLNGVPWLEQVEVVRGPGATLWGANAVNGVINILTKKASETQGALANVNILFELGSGDPVGVASLRAKHLELRA